MSKRDTQQWTLDESDVLAVDNGCWMDVVIGGYAVWWIERYCSLYEGEHAGEPLILRGCHEDGLEEWDIPDEFDSQQAAKRARRYIKQRRQGKPCDWQYEATVRMFGWQRNSKKWGRPIRRFRYASIWVPKKNKKTPTMSAWALYMECGDGEPGQKVFLMSKDARQVRENSARHIFEMIKASPDLTLGFKLNHNEMKAEYLPTRSVILPLSSAGENNQKSKEGLNGSAFVDETHVVDRSLMKRTSRMGISRSEPVMAEFSTAGTDPDSYGKDRFDYACKVRDGVIVDDSILTMVYACDQEIGDDEIALDPIKYGRLANPAWGHTIDEDEYLADYQRSKNSPSEMLDFRMYRLNIWQNSACPWLKPEHWRRGQREFVPADLLGMPCYAALDLSSISDFTSLCLCFPWEDEQFRFLWWYWLPEETARRVADKVPMHEWMADDRAQLTLTDGERIHYAYIRSKFRELSDEYDILELAYDDWNAEQTTQEISEGVIDQHGNEIEPATGIPRVNFPQGIKTFNEPTKQFETAVIDGLIHHNGDPLTAWMMSNATVKPDANGNYKPLKPGRDSLKKIDGVITAIMARARALAGESNTSPGLMIL